MVNTGMALFVLPLEAERLNGSNGSIWVGIYLAVCGLTQTICPIAGKLSDRHASRYGRRRPFIAAGTVVTVLAFAAMRLASVMMWPKVYIVFLFLGELALNVVYSAQCGLPADLQGINSRESLTNSVENSKVAPDDGTKGIISGYVALHSFLGSICAMGMIYLTSGFPVQAEYPVYMFSLVAACGVVCMSVREVPTDDRSVLNQPLTFKELRHSYLIDLEEDLDFFWVCAGRMFYYISTSSVVFLYYYIRDLVVRGDEAQVRSHLATLVILAQLAGASCSIPCSQLSNKIGRKAVIYGANSLMAVTFLLYVIAPKCGVFAWPCVLSAGLCYGIGSGAYLSVDYALALDCMPARKTTAEAFGLWGIAGFLGSTVGPMFGGFLLATSKGHSVAGSDIETSQPWTTREYYPYIGYALVLLCTGSIMNGVVALLTSRIRGLGQASREVV
jgi:MFS family permease